MAPASPISVGILTVSDTAFYTEPSDPSLDKSGPALRNLLASVPESPFNVVSSAIVPDDPTEIRRIVEKWCDDGIDLVLTSGGTGFGVRDRTPEAIAPLIDKPAPGFVTLMMTTSLSITPLAAISRPVAGIRISTSNPDSGCGTTIITLPGSPKGATENLQSLLKILPHAVDLARGGTGSNVHKLLNPGSTARGESSADKKGATVATALGLVGAGAAVGAHSHDHDHGHSHEHHHHHHSHGRGHHAPKPRTLLSLDPSSSVADRQRHSPYPLVQVRDAMDLIFKNTPLTPLETLLVDENLLGHVIGEDVVCAKDLPENGSTNVDGYAVLSTSPPGVYKVLTSYPTGPVPSDTIYRINTGAPVPPQFDSVIMVEDTKVVSRSSDGEEETVETLAQVDPKENVRAPGSDVKKGEKVLDTGDVISAVGGELGTLAFVGRRSVAAYRRPIVAVLSTGNELVNIQDTSPASNPHSNFSAIPDSNRPSLVSILKHFHYEVLDLGIVGDSMEATTKALKRGKEGADVIITTGGTSMGVGDLLKPCIERELGGTVHFGRVAMKPGKPTTFATVPAHPMAPNQSSKLIFALPGNPASALVTFFLFVLPALRKMEGRRQSEWELPRVPVQITSKVPLDPRAEYHRVWLRPTPSATGVSLKAFSTGGQRSSRTVSLAGANGLLELPAMEKGGKKEIEEGATVPCVVIGEIGSLVA